MTLHESKTEKFLWGAATSSHQVEGYNKNSDWWQFEISGKAKSQSGAACNHYQLYNKDFDIAKSLHHNAHRLSIEWSRVEPEEGKFDDEAIKHYKDVISALKERGIAPVVTLHHFTNPIWLADRGGWADPDAVKYFARFSERMAQAIGEDVTYWVTVNEPMVYVYQGYINGIWPPGERLYDKGLKVLRNLILGHASSYKSIHKVYKDNSWRKPMVSLANSAGYFSPCSLKSPLDKISTFIRSNFYNNFIFHSILNGLIFFPGVYFEPRPDIKGTLDYLAINYYTRDFVHFEGFLPPGLFGRICSFEHHRDSGERNSLGWEVYPEGLYKLLMQYKKCGLPMMITENGICTENDERRRDFIKGHLAALKRAMAGGANIIGYLYWSLLDNFEWAEGFTPRFGLVEVDYNTQERKVRQSALEFAEICKNGIDNLF